MKVEFYGHVRQYHNIKAEIDANIHKVLESGQYVMGPMLKQFEGELAAYHGTKYGIGTANGTDSLWLALMALGIGAGDEVITHANTFFATESSAWNNVNCVFSTVTMSAVPARSCCSDS